MLRRLPTCNIWHWGIPRTAKVITNPKQTMGTDSSKNTSHTTLPWKMNTYQQVYVHSKERNGKRNGIAERRRRRIQAGSAESFPWSHGKDLCPERASSVLLDHENLNDTVTLRAKCSGAPAHTRPTEVLNCPRSVTNNHHHHWTNYQMSSDSSLAPPQVQTASVFRTDRRLEREGQHVSLRPVVWNGSKLGRAQYNRLITPGRWMAKKKIGRAHV